MAEESQDRRRSRRDKTKSSQHKGSIGEDRAVQWLDSRGFAIVARNQRSCGSEIDIIAVRNLELHFVEVKTWAFDMAEAERAVGYRKRASLLSGARAWLGKNPQYLDYSIQFDLIYFDTLSRRLDFVEGILD